MAYDEQYDNPNLWRLVSDNRGKDYASVKTVEPVVWVRVALPGGMLAYRCGEYEIVGRVYSKMDRRVYIVRRLGIELPLSFTSLLHDAKARAVKNSRGEDRMHLA